MRLISINNPSTICRFLRESRFVCPTIFHSLIFYYEFRADNEEMLERFYKCVKPSILIVQLNALNCSKKRGAFPTPQTADKVLALCGDF